MCQRIIKETKKSESKIQVKKEKQRKVSQEDWFVKVHNVDNAMECNQSHIHVFNLQQL